MIIVHHGMQLVLAVFEVWLCYQLLFATVIDKEKLGLIGRCAIWINIWGLGILLACNRNLTFFSRLMLIFCILVTWMFAIGIMHGKALISLGIVMTYYAFLALLDLLFAFVCMCVLKEDFGHVIYLGAKSLRQVLIFTCSRVITSFVVLQIWKNRELKNNFNVSKGIILGIGCALVIILRQYQIILDEMVNGEQKIRFESGFSLLVIIFLIVIAEIVLLQNKVIQRENTYLILKDRMTEQMYQELLESNEKTRQLIHDINNHLLVLSKYEREGDLKNIHNYLKELNQELLCDENRIWTGNRVLDFLLNQKKSVAEQKKIEFHIVTIAIPVLPFSMSELCSLFSNLLDNAIEACEKIEDGNRWIQIKMDKREGIFLIKIVNSIKEYSLEGNESLSTTKIEKDIHGYGLKCVKRIVDKYDGTLKYQSDTDKFQIDITFLNM